MIMALQKIPTNNFSQSSTAVIIIATLKKWKTVLRFGSNPNLVHIFYSSFKFQSYLYTLKCKYPQTSEWVPMYIIILL